MRLKIITIIITLLYLCSCQNEVKKIEVDPIEAGKEISFYTSDSIEIIGDLYELDKNAPVILLFHQGGSNARAEYSPIIPRLLKDGFNVLAIDQRMGGQVYGSYNRTLAKIPDHSFSNPYGYCDAYNNLESALDFVISSGFTGNKILWGSSYSASLAIQLANNRQDDINRVLAFSPASGGPMEECRPDQYFETLKIPLLLLRPPNEMEHESVKLQFKLANENGHQTFAAKHGTHGSSMLVAERVGHNVDEAWEVVMSFLKNTTGK